MVGRDKQLSFKVYNLENAKIRLSTNQARKFVEKHLPEKVKPAGVFKNGTEHSEMPFSYWELRKIGKGYAFYAAGKIRDWNGLDDLSFLLKKDKGSYYVRGRYLLEKSKRTIYGPQCFRWIVGDKNKIVLLAAKGWGKGWQCVGHVLSSDIQRELMRK